MTTNLWLKIFSDDRSKSMKVCAHGCWIGICPRKWSSIETGDSRWLEAIWRPLVSDVECAGADRHRGPGSCMPAFSVYGPITSRLEEKINRRRGTDDVSLQPDDRPMRRGRRRPISTEQSISKDIQRCRQ